MRELAKKRLLFEAAGRRKREVEKCLSDYGQIAGPHRRLHRASLADKDCRYRRLGAALTSLGPVFSSFGIYLSSRADLLSARDCFELAAIPDRADTSDISAVRRLISSELPVPQAEVYNVFEEEPFESRLLFQSHRARLLSGQMVTVTVVHPELDEYLVTDLELLFLLEQALAGLPLDQTVADFRISLNEKTDLLGQAERIAEFGRQSASATEIRVPVVCRDFCGSKLLTCEHLFGSNLGELLSPFDVPDADEFEASRTFSPGQDVEFGDLAGRLSLAWLRLSLQGKMFPVDPRPENIQILPDQKIAFNGVSFAMLPSDQQSNLLDYLIAVVSQEPDRACAYLLREMKRVEGVLGEAELRQRFRQVIPFRDGGWSGGGESPGLAAYVFAHLKLCTDSGFRPQGHLLSFFRGFFQIATITGRLAPDRDPFPDGLQELRMELVFDQCRDMLRVGRLGDSLDKYATLMTEFPKRLNDALTQAAEGNTRAQLESPEVCESRSSKNSSAIVVGLLFLLMASVLLVHHMSASIGASVWGNRIAAVVCVLVGALLLRAAGRAS